MSRLWLSLLLASFPEAVLGANGLLEISQPCAVHTGCFSGDAPGFPVTISASGSYVLTSHLDAESASGAAIEITAADVTLDLGSFRVIGAIGDHDESIIEATANAVAIRNGTVTGSIHLQDASSIQNVKVDGFSVGVGVRVGAMGLISNCVIDEGSGAADAIRAGPDSLIVQNRTYSGDSINVSGSIVLRNRTASNGALLDASDRSLVVGNSLDNDEGLALSMDSSYRLNRITEPGDGPWVSGGIDAGGNLCETSFSSGNIWFPCP